MRRKRFSQLGKCLGCCQVNCFVAIALQCNTNCWLQLGSCCFFNCCKQLCRIVKNWCVLEWHDWSTSCDHAGNELALQLDRIFDELLAHFETARDDFFSHLWCTRCVIGETLFSSACFHHHHCNVTIVEFTTSNNDFECCFFALFECWVRNPGAVLAVGQAHCTNWSVKRNARDHERSRCCVDCENVVWIFLVGTDNGDHNLCLVAVAIWEGWTQWTVCQTTGKDCCLAWSAFATEE